MMIRFTFFVSLLLFASSSFAQQLREADRCDIAYVIAMQEEAWNRGDIEEYMAGYLRSDSLRFISGGTISYGWDSTYARYKRGYPDKNTMGKLEFSDLKYESAGEGAAIVYGKWELIRKEDRPWGRFTLLFRKTPDGWRIVHDHTSVAK